MNFRTGLKITRWVFLLGLLLAACSGSELPTPPPTLTLAPPSSPTLPPATEDISPALTAVATHTPAAAQELAPTNTAPSVTNTPAPTAVQTSYAVIYVEPNDELNVRSGPGVDFAVVGTLPPNATDVQITGSGQLVAGSTWVPVRRGALGGWVNSRFLTQFVPDEAFCGDTAVLQLIDRLETAVANEDDAALAQLIHPERGLRVRLLWHEAETRLDNQGVFSDATSYNWGNAAGSGEPILGTPAQVLLPRLQTDFLAATEMACNEILHGGSAGFIILPDAYAPLNYYAFHRPGTEEFAELNWGTWVVGLELWQGQYFVSALVHFQWEP